MLDITAQALAVLAGSWTPQVQVDAWYDGELVRAGLPVSAAGTNEDASQTILGSGSTTSVSADDSLIPTSWDSPLACYGSQLHIRQGIPLTPDQVEWFSLGWFVINDFDCNDWWREVTRPDGTVVWQPQGTQVTNNLSDRWALIDQATFAIAEKPGQLDSAKTELARLVDGLADLADLTAVADAAIPAAITYGDSRSDAVQQIAGLLAMTARMNRDGALTLVPVDPSSTPLWTVAVTDDDEAARIVSYTRKGDRTGLYNEFVSAGQSPGGTPVQAVVKTGSGPLRCGGPLGTIPLRNDSQLLTTDTACQADAQAAQREYGGGQTVLIPATVPSNPALETGDVIALILPKGNTLTGPVATIDRGDLFANTMDITVKVSRTDLWSSG